MKASIATILQRLWMGIVLLCGRIVTHSVRESAVSSFSVSAISQVSQRWSRLTPVGSQFPQALFSSSRSEPAEKERIPATGWNHNVPTNPNFWQSPDLSDRDSVVPSDNKSAKPVRTGWLHNTEPRHKQPTSTQEIPTSKARQRIQQAMVQKERNHRIISAPAFHACGNDRQIVVTEHRLSVPIFRAQTDSPRIDVAFTIVEKVKDLNAQDWFQSLTSLSPQQRATSYVEKAALSNADDMMVYLQGGPGFGAPVPVVALGFSQDSSWGAKALTKFDRIVLMDQRGTGMSTPITKQSLEKRFPDMFLLDDKEESDVKKLAVSHPEEHGRFQTAVQNATDFLAQFRADNIVKDAEEIKEALMLPAGQDSEPRPWGGVLGQSFGGFCVLSYLSLVAHPPKICILTGGIGPILDSPYNVYTKLWDRVRKRSLLYYSQFPDDVALVKRIVQHLLDKPAKLPSGGTLTARRFLQYGMALGGSPSSFATMHRLFQSAFLQPEGTELTRAFLKAMDTEQPFDDHPIYFWLHESCYANGTGIQTPTAWASHRAYLDKIEQHPEFDYQKTSAGDGQPTLFFGEMVFPWMAQDYAECGGVGCTAMVEALAHKDDWPNLYNGTHMRQVLGDGTSRAAAAVYYDDMYVDFDCSMKVTAPGNPLEKCKVFVTNDYQHSGIRDDGANLFAKLYGMATGSVQTPS